MRIGSVTSTMLFTGPAARPRQIVQVTLVEATGPVTVAITGAGVSTPEPARVAGDRIAGDGVAGDGVAGDGVAGDRVAGEQVAEVGIEVASPALPGGTRSVTVIADAGPGGRAEQAAEVTIAEPGWTMWMVSHFHYDPVWWSTQGQFLQTRLLLPGDDGRLPDVRTA